MFYFVKKKEEIHFKVIRKTYHVAEFLEIK